MVRKFMLIIFPKIMFYTGKNSDEQRSYERIIKSNLDIVYNAGFKAQILLEDEYARTALARYDNFPVDIKTCICPTDCNFINQYPEVEELDNQFFEKYSFTDKICYNVEKDYTVPMTLLKQGKEVYFKKRCDIYRKRYKKAIDTLISRSSYVMQFLINSKCNRGVPVSTTISQGDGRLCIEVHLDSGLFVGYYGGMHIDEDMLKTILTL